MGELSSFLFARPSFLEGMARTLDLGATMQEYNGSASGEEADETALRLDVEAVNKDMALVEAMSRSQRKEIASHGK